MNTILSYWPSLALLCLSAPFYAYCALHDEGKLHGFGPDEGFFGFNQYRRKYKSVPREIGGWVVAGQTSAIKAPDTWYYRFFKLKYKEKFPFSATFLAFLTDGYHLFQLIWKALVIDSMAILTPWPWTVFLSGFSAFTFVFALFYKLLSR